MKWLVVFMTCVFLVCSVSLAADAQCPEGKWFHPKLKRCITPGDDPTGAVGRDFRRRIMDEGQAYCVDGYCCPDEASFEKCKDFLWQKRWNCLKKNGCFKYGE